MMPLLLLLHRKIENKEQGVYSHFIAAVQIKTKMIQKIMALGINVNSAVSIWEMKLLMCPFYNIKEIGTSVRNSGVLT